jgi:hypothetical protein
MFGRTMRTKLPELSSARNLFDEEYSDKDWQSKLNGKTYSDRRRGAVNDPVKVGDVVLVKADRAHKLSTNFDRTPCTVTKREGGEVTLRRNGDGVEMRRHTTAVKKLVISDDGLSATTSGDVPDTEVDAAEPVADIAESVPDVIESKPEPRPKRNAGLPSKYMDYEIPEKFRK